MRKHAPGADVHATLARAGSTLLTIRNTNSANAEVARYPASGWGIDGMRVRAEQLHGTLTSRRDDEG